MTGELSETSANTAAWWPATMSLNPHRQVQAGPVSTCTLAPAPLQALSPMGTRGCGASECPVVSPHTPVTSP